jgi:hypothetical protein
MEIVEEEIDEGQPAEAAESPDSAEEEHEPQGTDTGPSDTSGEYPQDSDMSLQDLSEPPMDMDLESGAQDAEDEPGDAGPGDEPMPGEDLGGPDEPMSEAAPDEEALLDGEPLFGRALLESGASFDLQPLPAEPPRDEFVEHAADEDEPPVEAGTEWVEDDGAPHSPPVRLSRAW